MKVLKYIGIRLLLIAALFMVLNELYHFTFWKSDVNKHADTLENLWNVPPHAEAIYFGESSNFHVAPTDSTKHRISFILDSLSTRYAIQTVDNAGLHAGTYLALMKNIPHPEDLRFVVVTMNLRSFGPVWLQSHFETNLSKLERLIEPGPKLWNRFLIALNEYDLKSNEERDAALLTAFANDTFHVKGVPFQTIAEWDKAIAWREWHGIRPFADQQEIDLAAHYIKNFAFEIDPDTNPRIAQFDGIMEWAKAHNCTVIFNLLGENMQQASALIGPTIVSLIDKNRQFLIKRYTDQGAIVADNLYAVPDHCFVDRNWPTEHYNLEGKTIVAARLAQIIEALPAKN